MGSKRSSVQQIAVVSSDRDEGVHVIMKSSKAAFPDACWPS